MSRVIRNVRINPNDDSGEWADLLRAAGIPERYWLATVGAIKNPKLAADVCEMLKTAPLWIGEGMGWFLNGPLNSGKSSIAAILAMEALKRCERVGWVSIRDVPAIRFRENDAMKRIDDRLRTLDVLVLDDFGAERFRLASAAGTALEEVVRMVYDRRRTLIVTSNIGWNDFQTHYGREAAPLMSVVSRIVLPVTVQNEQWGTNKPTP